MEPNSKEQLETYLEQHQKRANRCFFIGHLYGLLVTFLYFSNQPPITLLVGIAGMGLNYFFGLMHEKLVSQIQEHIDND